LTNKTSYAIIITERTKELKVMKYLIEARMVYEVKDTYREAEIFCCERGIHPEVIVEITDEEAEEILG
jgi:hypothetical protein